MVDYVTRPAELSGCWSSWREQDQPQFLRTSMDISSPKVRLRYTGVHRRADVTAPILFDYVDTFWLWYRNLCHGGTLPTNIVEPDGREAVWRFTVPPVMNYPDLGRKYVEIQCSIERLPGYQWL